jgi:hypothetical protein
VGVGGSQGVQGTSGSAIFHRLVDTRERRGCVSFDLNVWAGGVFAATTNPQIFGLEWTSAVQELFTVTINRANLNVSIRNSAFTIIATSANNVVPAPGTFANYRIEFLTSTWVGPGATTFAADAEARVYIDGVLVVSATGFTMIGAGSQEGYVNAHLGPMAGFDRLVIKG